MKIAVYLDQNTLSDLRERKINNGDSLSATSRKLKNLLSSDKFIVIYSHVHLIEIQQILDERFRFEHIELLEEVKAVYIEPTTRILREKPASKIWKEFLENEELNIQYGMDKAIAAISLWQRKIVGLPIEESFSQINEKQKSTLINMIKSTTEELFQLNLEKELGVFDEPLQKLVKEAFLLASHNIEPLLARITEMEFPVIEDENLGPKLFRDSSEIRNLKVETIPVERVVDAIEDVFKKVNEDFDSSAYMEKIHQNRIGYSYDLMNWAGYYPDDFSKIKKGKDRFNASRNDMMHAMTASGLSFLISRDEPFLKKALACYHYVDSETIVCSPTELINNYDFGI